MEPGWVFPVTSADTIPDTEVLRIPNVRLNVANSPGNVMLVRQALGGLAEAIDLDRVDVNDLNMAVTEACNNVVLHAYDGGPGPLEVELYAAAAELCVVVRDHGVGIPAPADPPEQIGGIGLQLVEALADSVEYSAVPGGGTELRMSFVTDKAGRLELPCDDRGLELRALPQDGSLHTTRIAIAPGKLAQAVLPRVLCALAAYADFSVDRISDTQMLADALVARIDRSMSASHLNIGIDVAPRNLEICIGPLRAGSADELVLESSVAGLGPVLERLTDGRHAVSPDGPSETLTLRLAGRR